MTVVKLYNGTVWETCVFKVWDGSVWQEVPYYWDGSAWVELNASAAGPEVSPSISDVRRTNPSGTCYAGLQINLNGTEYTNLMGSSSALTISRGLWLDSGLSSEVWIERTVNSGDLNWRDPGAGRLICSTTREYGCRKAGQDGTEVANVTFDYYDAASGGSLLDSVTITIEAIKGLA